TRGRTRGEAARAGGIDRLLHRLGGTGQRLEARRRVIGHSRREARRWPLARRGRRRRDRRRRRVQGVGADRPGGPGGRLGRKASPGEPSRGGDAGRSGDPCAVTAASGPAVRTFLIADVRGYTSFTEQRGDEAAGRLVSAFA